MYNNCGKRKPFFANLKYQQSKRSTCYSFFFMAIKKFKLQYQNTQTKYLCYTKVLMLQYLLISNLNHNIFSMIFYRFPTIQSLRLYPLLMKGNKYMGSTNSPSHGTFDQTQAKGQHTIKTDNPDFINTIFKAQEEDKKFLKLIFEQNQKRQIATEEQWLAMQKKRMEMEKQRMDREEERLEMEKQRMDREERRLEMEKQRMDREEEYRKKRMVKDRIATSGIIAGIASFLFALVQYVFDPIEVYNQYWAVRKCKDFQFDDEEYIDSPIYKQAQKSIKQQNRGKIKLVAGCSGIGKTMAVKKLLKTIQIEGELTFYFSFGDYNSGQEKKKIKQQFYWFIRGLKRKYKNGENVKVVFDDINRVETGDPQDFRQIMENIYRLVGCPNLNVICISSSGSFLENQIAHPFWRALFKKSGSAIILEDSSLDMEIMKNFHIQVLKKISKQQLQNDQKNKKFEESPIPSNIAEMRVTTRRAVEILHQYLDKFSKLDLSKSENVENGLKFIKQIQRFEVKMLKTKIDLSMPKNINDQTYISLLQKLEACRRERLSLQNCTITLQNYKMHEAQVVDAALKSLDKNNLIIFCRPRTQMEAQAFREYIEQNRERQRAGQKKVN